jgi:hypothetical protein
MRNITEIIIHCSATRPEWMAGKTIYEKVNEIRRWHVEDRKWSDIGYAALIGPFGAIAKGRDLDRDGDVWEEIGAHTRGRNTRSIGICLIGGHGAKADDRFSDHFTPEQDKALRILIADLQDQFPTITKISGHNEYANKACPGFNVAEWLSEGVEEKPVNHLINTPAPTRSWSWRQWLPWARP